MACSIRQEMTRLADPTETSTPPPHPSGRSFARAREEIIRLLQLCREGRLYSAAVQREKQRSQHLRSSARAEPLTCRSPVSAVGAIAPPIPPPATSWPSP